MTGLSLIAAVSVGAVIGAAGRMLATRCRTVPVWLPLAAGVAAALLATVLTRMAATDGPGRRSSSSCCRCCSRPPGSRWWR